MKTNKMFKALNKVINIFFADAKQSWERITCIFSALFWTWLEFGFIKFFFGYAIGMYYAVYEKYPESIRILLENRNFIDSFSIIVVLLIFVTRIPLYFRKEVAK